MKTINKIALAGILLLTMLLVTTTASAAVYNFTSPQYGRTYPYSTNLKLSALVDPFAENCTYQIIWQGDISGHPDDSYPAFAYDIVEVDCGVFKDPGLKFSVDFDGNYTINVTGDQQGTTYSNYTKFYIDREELDGSKILAGMFYPLLMLLIVYFIFKVGQSLAEEHDKIKLLFTVIPIFTLPLIIYTATSIILEYFKFPTMNNMANILLWVVLVGIIFVFTAYLLIYLTIKALNMFNPEKKFDDG